MKIIKLVRLPMKQDIHNFSITKKNEITSEMGHDHFFPLFTGFCKILCKMVKSPMKRDMEISQTTNEMGHIAKTPKFTI